MSEAFGRGGGESVERLQPQTLHQSSQVTVKIRYSGDKGTGMGTLSCLLRLEEGNLKGESDGNFHLILLPLPVVQNCFVTI